MAASCGSKVKRKLWQQDSMLLAIKSVDNGQGLREAARAYNVPVETLRRRIVGITSADARPGRDTVLTSEEESKLSQYIIDMCDMGFGISRQDVMRVAFSIVEKSGRRHPFTNGMAGRAWFDGFRSRNPNLTMRISQPLSYSRATNANKETVDDFFAKLGAIYARLNLLSKPMQIFNVDETGITVVHKPGKVITQVGRKNVWPVTSGEKGKTHTVITCVSASGFALPPMMIYPRKRIAEKLKQGATPETYFECSDSGWINEELYIKWFKFFLAKIPPTRPVLLIEDGHSSHISIDVIQLARDNGIHLLCLPAHTTHLLQPLDVGVFKSLKSKFSVACKNYLSSHPGQVITTDVLASLLAQSWHESVTAINIMKGFRKCGIYPLNPGEISDRQLAPSHAFRPPIDSKSVSKEDEEQEKLYQKRYEEGYDLDDPKYTQWLKTRKLLAFGDHSDKVSVTESTKESSTPSIVSTCAPDSDHASLTTSSSMSASDALGDILKLPQPKVTKKKRKAGLNSKAVCITDDNILQELVEVKKKKEQKKPKKEVISKRINEEKKEEQRKEGKKTGLRSKSKDKITKKATQQLKSRKLASSDEGLSMQLQDLLKICSDSESEAECPKCGLIYGETEDRWICCDLCDTWIDFDCAGISKGDVPEEYYCSDCL